MVFIIVLLFLSCSSAFSATYQVGADKQYSKPSQVAGIVQNGDTVAIDAGLYSSDVAIWRANNLTLKGVGNGFAYLRADGDNAEGKAIWVIKGKNTTIENIEFSGCAVPDKNGAGIRQEGINLTVRKCYFHDNENGILAGKNDLSYIILEQCEFAYNGYGDGYSHNIYIGQVESFSMNYCYSHHAKIGHCVKSRAQHNNISFNRIMDEWDGTSSMLIDLPNGGYSLVGGNVLMQGVNTDNRKLITYGKEGLVNSVNRLYFVHNTLVNYRNLCDFIDIEQGTEQAIIVNNIFAGPGNLIIGSGFDSTNNIQYSNIDDAGFVAPDSLDYHLNSESSAMDAGNYWVELGDMEYVPGYEYVHPCSFKERIIENTLDLGAFEYHKPVSADNSISGDINIKVYPNPFTEKCRFEAQKGAEIKIYDLLGNLVFHGFFVNDNIIWTPDKQLNSGLYFIEISHNGKVKYTHIIIQ